jgi:endoglucanase
MIELLKKLMLTPGVSGREEKIRQAIEDEVKPYADEIITDNMGNLIVRKKGQGKKIMLCAHMDEIGFFVTHIGSNGLLSVSPIGGINFLSAAYSEVVSENGVYGVLIPTVKKAIPAGDEVKIDIGAKDKKQAERKVRVGDSFMVKPSLRRLLNNKYVGRPFDDRIGCLALIEALKNIKDCKNDLYFVFSVQEEVGGRGSYPATYQIKPDIAIAVDVTCEGDKPNAPKIAVSLGKGCAIKIKDSSMICNGELVQKMRDIATENKIKYQNEILPAGGTDGANMQITAGGSLAGVISIPTAFIHSGIEMIDIKDVESSIKLLTHLCCEL